MSEMNDSDSYLSIESEILENNSVEKFLRHLQVSKISKYSSTAAEDSSYVVPRGFSLISYGFREYRHENHDRSQNGEICISDTNRGDFSKKYP